MNPPKVVWLEVAHKIKHPEPLICKHAFYF